MSESGVIPPPEERRPYDGPVREVGRIEDSEGFTVSIGVGGGQVFVDCSPPVGFTRSQAEQFARLFVRACWEATMPP